MRTVSKKRARLMRGPRADLNRALEITPRRCDLGWRFSARNIDSGCTGRATCWHELRKRSAGGSLVNPANVLPACGPCNRFVEAEPLIARELGLVTRPGDAGWDEMSARRDG